MHTWFEDWFLFYMRIVVFAYNVILIISYRYIYLDLRPILFSLQDPQVRIIGSCNFTDYPVYWLKQFFKIYLIQHSRSVPDSFGVKNNFLKWPLVWLTFISFVRLFWILRPLSKWLATGVVHLFFCVYFFYFRNIFLKQGPKDFFRISVAIS